MEDGGAEPRKHSSPPLPHPPFPARRGGEGGGERSTSEGARGRRKRPPCPPRPPSSSPEPAAGRPGPALGELKWRTAFSSSSSSPLLPSRAGAAGKMEDSGIVPGSAAAPPPALSARARKLSLPVRSPSHTLACPVSRGARAAGVTPRCRCAARGRRPARLRGGRAGAARAGGRLPKCVTAAPPGLLAAPRAAPAAHWPPPRGRRPLPPRPAGPLRSAPRPAGAARRAAGREPQENAFWIASLEAFARPLSGSLGVVLNPVLNDQD
uniref:translation initiation factor IF-2-like n=1 Tax=Agelaius phoeniceus TaxID=39638 RepID=UPI0023EAC2AD|nr:translation initiation factor IF-2-like [Agelaius phoeniceus]